MRAALVRGPAPQQLEEKRRGEARRHCRSRTQENWHLIAQREQVGENGLKQAAQEFAAERFQEIGRAAQLQGEALLRIIKAPTESVLIGLAIGCLLGWVGAAAVRSHLDAASSSRRLEWLNRRRARGALG